jgi:hypothetical protein
MKETYGTHKVGFDPMKKADITSARLHGDAKMVRNLDAFSKRHANEEMICECCGLPVEADLFPLCAPINDLKELGPGIPLYYWFVKYVAIVLLTGFLLVGIACWASNAGRGAASDYGDDSDKNYIIVMSLGNHGHPDERSTVPVWQSILHIVFMILILITYYWLRNFQFRKEFDIDINLTTPSDYTLWVRGLGKKIDTEDVKTFFSENGRRDGKPVDIVKVNIPYDISDYVDAIRDHTDIKEKILYLDEYMEKHDGARPTEGACCCFRKEFPTKEELELQLAASHVEIQKFEEETEVGVGRDLVVGHVFLTCRT